MELTGTVAVVTGGATGVGRAVCEALAKAGCAAVIVNYFRSASEAAQTVEGLERLGSKGEAIQADVADSQAAQHMIAAVLDRFGRLDVLVNNAGATVLAPFDDLDAMTDDVWDKLLGVNLLGGFYCSRAAADALKEASGAIVNITSTAAHRGSGSSIAYSVAKAALLHLTRGLAVALAPKVRVNAVSPGTVMTRWHEDLLGAEQAALKMEADSASTPLQNVAAPADVADAVLGFLKADFVTGESLIVDGGKHLLY